MCDGFESVKASAKKIAHTNNQSEINQRKHTQILCNLADNTGANPKRAISSVKRAPKLFSTAGRRTGCSKNIRDPKFCVLQFSGRTAMCLRTWNSLQTANAARAGFGQSKGIATWPPH